MVLFLKSLSFQRRNRYKNILPAYIIMIQFTWRRAVMIRWEFATK